MSRRRPSDVTNRPSSRTVIPRVAGTGETKYLSRVRPRFSRSLGIVNYDYAGDANIGLGRTSAQADGEPVLCWAPIRVILTVSKSRCIDGSRIQESG